MNFKVGDTVRCIDTKGPPQVRRDWPYSVLGIAPDGSIYIDLVHNAARFELVRAAEPATKAAKFKGGDAVTFTGECSPFRWFGPHTDYKHGVVMAEHPASVKKYAVTVSNSGLVYINDNHAELRAPEPERPYKIGDWVRDEDGVVGLVLDDDLDACVPYLVRFPYDLDGDWHNEDELTPWAPAVGDTVAAGGAGVVGIVETISGDTAMVSYTLTNAWTRPIADLRPATTAAFAKLT